MRPLKTLYTASLDWNRVEQPALPSYNTIGDRMHHLRAEVGSGFRAYLEYTAVWDHTQDRSAFTKVAIYSLDGEFTEQCRATVARRTGRASTVKVGAVQEIRSGPGLAVLALRCTGGILWVAPSAKDLNEVPSPKADAGLIRWAKVDLEAVRAEAPRWAKAEGPARPEQVRPLSDRVLGLLGWMPATSSLSVERRKTATGWEEKVIFGSEKKLSWANARAGSEASGHFP